MRYAAQRGLDQVLGFRAGNQNIGRDMKREPVELLLAEDVLDGLVLGAAVEPLFVGGLLLGCEFGIGVSEEKGAVAASGADEQQLRVAPSCGYGSEAGGSMVEGSGEGHV